MSFDSRDSRFLWPRPHRRLRRLSKVALACPSFFLYHPPERNVNLFASWFEVDPDLCADLDRLRSCRIHSAQDRQHSVALIEVYVGCDKGDFVSPPADGSVLHSECVYAPFPGRFYPFEFGRVTVGAD